MSPTDDYRQARCKHGWVDQVQCEQCREVAGLLARSEKAEWDLSAAREEIELLRARLEPFAAYARLWANWKPGQMEAKPERPFIEYYIMADEALRSRRTKGETP